MAFQNEGEPKERPFENVLKNGQEDYKRTQWRSTNLPRLENNKSETKKNDGNKNCPQLTVWRKRGQRGGQL
jgi:hypothetical protein